MEPRAGAGKSSELGVKKEKASLAQECGWRRGVMDGPSSLSPASLVKRGEDESARSCTLTAQGVAHGWEDGKLRMQQQQTGEVVRSAFLSDSPAFWHGESSG